MSKKEIMEMIKVANELSLLKDNSLDDYNYIKNLIFDISNKKRALI